MKEMLSRSATTIGGRDGIVKDTQSQMTFKLAKPKEMGGSGLDGTNPEELFSVGYSACLASSMEYLLNVEKVKYDHLYVKAETKLLMIENKGFEFKLIVEARILGVDKETEKAFVIKAKNFCPYSKAISGNVEIEMV